MNVSILSVCAARVKPIQALTAYVSFAKITLLTRGHSAKHYVHVLIHGGY